MNSNEARKGVFVKHHWLFGDIYMAVKIEKESDCSKCRHLDPCKVDMANFCLNYVMGTSEGRRGCDQCIHRFTRWDKDEDKIPCFVCRWFEQGPRTKERRVQLTEVKCCKCGKWTNIEEKGDRVRDTQLMNQCDCGHSFCSECEWDYRFEEGKEDDLYKAS